MAEWTTYLSVVDTAGTWSNTANAVDNDTGTYASRAALGMNTMILDTPSAASASGAISKVEMRIYGGLADLGVPAKLYLAPRFIAGDGDSENINLIPSSWSSWFDITADTNAPGAWAWSDVQALGANVIYSWGSGPAPEARCAAVEIRVTYASTPTPTVVFGNGAFKVKRNIIIGG